MIELNYNWLMSGSIIIIGLGIWIEMRRSRDKYTNLNDWATKNPKNAIAWTIVIAILLVTMMSNGGATAYTTIADNFTPHLPQNYTSPFINITVPGHDVQIFNQTVRLPYGI